MLLPTLHGHAINCVPVHRFRMRRTPETGLPLAARREILRYALARILMHAVKTEPARFWRVFGWFVALFYRFPVRNALRASQAVHATDVMVNNYPYCDNFSFIFGAKLFSDSTRLVKSYTFLPLYLGCSLLVFLLVIKPIFSNSANPR